MQLKIDGKPYDVRKEVGELIHMISKERDVLRGFVDDWNEIFPDKGPREIRAELDQCPQTEQVEESSLSGLLCGSTAKTDKHMEQNYKCGGCGRFMSSENYQSPVYRGEKCPKCDGETPAA